MKIRDIETLNASTRQKACTMIINGIEYTGEALLDLGEAGKKASKAAEKFVTTIRGTITQCKPPIKKRNKRLTKKLDVYNRFIKACK